MLNYTSPYSVWRSRMGIKQLYCLIANYNYYLFKAQFAHIWKISTKEELSGVRTIIESGNQIDRFGPKSETIDSPISSTDYRLLWILIHLLWRLRFVAVLGVAEERRRSRRSLSPPTLLCQCVQGGQTDCSRLTAGLHTMQQIKQTDNAGSGWCAYDLWTELHCRIWCGRPDPHPRTTVMLWI